jgi:hypothetical protein
LLAAVVVVHHLDLEQDQDYLLVLVVLVAAVKGAA